MEVDVVWGRGEARTELSAFDAALDDAGVANYNLVTLSSVVPAGATVRETGTHDEVYDVGDAVCVVLAENASIEPGETVAAGIGWATAEEGGVFYEASADSAAACRELLRTGLADARTLRDWSWADENEYRTCEHVVETAGAAVVAAVFEPIAYATDHE